MDAGGLRRCAVSVPEQGFSPRNSSPFSRWCLLSSLSAFENFSAKIGIGYEGYGCVGGTDQWTRPWAVVDVGVITGVRILRDGSGWGEDDGAATGPGLRDIIFRIESPRPQIEGVSGCVEKSHLFHEACARRYNTAQAQVVRLTGRLASTASPFSTAL